MAISDRYHRQRLVDGIGDSGQELLGNSKVAIVGVGALGCMSASLIARAGIGSITLIDRDIVEISNLQRQILFDEDDALTHQPKSIAAAKHLGAVNSEIEIISHVEDLTARNIERLLEGAMVIVDGLDNFLTRYLLNDYAVKTSTPYMFAGVIAGQGNTMTILPENSSDSRTQTPCLRCIFPDPPPVGSQETCDTAGVLGPAIGIAASCQAMDTIKYLSGNVDKIARSILTFDLWDTQSTRLSLGEPILDCQCCGKQQFEFLNDTITPQATPLCGKNAVQIPSSGTFDLAHIAIRLADHGSFISSEVVIRGALNEEQSTDGKPIELFCFHDGRIIVHGTDDVGRAKAICARYVGR